MAVSDSIILELFSRVQKCENYIKLLNEKVELLENDKHVSSNGKDFTGESDEENDEKQISTRSQARELIMEKMRKLLPDAVIRTGNRNEGSGIVVSDNKGLRRFKLYHSKSYDVITNNMVSWSGILKSDLDNDSYDGYIFSIWSDKQYVLLFTQQQLLDIIHATNKSCDGNNKYHFSFTIMPDKRVFETRSSEYFDVSYSLDNYKIVKEFIVKYKFKS